jgi:hypothetical protein
MYPLLCQVSQSVDVWILIDYFEYAEFRVTRLVCEIIAQNAALHIFLPK